MWRRRFRYRPLPCQNRALALKVRWNEHDHNVYRCAYVSALMGPEKSSHYSRVVFIRVCFFWEEPNSEASPLLNIHFYIYLYAKA